MKSARSTIGWARLVVVDDQRHESGVDRDRSLPAALRLAHLEQAPREVDVVPVEPEQLAAPQTRVGHQREQQAVALRLGMEVPLPDLRSSRGGEQALELSHRQHVREHLALLRRPQRQRRIAQQALLLDQEAKEALQRRGRPRLTRDGRPALVFAREEGAQVRHLHLGELDPLTLQVSQTRRNVPLVCRASHRRKPPLEPAKAQEIRHFPARLRLHRSSFGQPSGPRWSEPWAYPAYRPATGKPLETGFFYGPDTPATRRAHPGAVGLRSPWYRPARSPDVAMRAVHEEAWRRIAARPASPTRSSVTAAPRSASGSC